LCDGSTKNSSRREMYNIAQRSIAKKNIGKDCRWLSQRMVVGVVQLHFVRKF